MLINKQSLRLTLLTMNCELGSPPIIRIVITPLSPSSSSVAETSATEVPIAEFSLILAEIEGSEKTGL